MSYVKIRESGIVFAVVCLVILASIAELAVTEAVGALGIIGIRAYPRMGRQLGRRDPARWPGSSGDNHVKAGGCGGIQRPQPPWRGPTPKRRSSYLSDNRKEHVKQTPGIPATAYGMITVTCRDQMWQFGCTRYGEVT
jgi:hypothetical protein